MNTKLKRPYGFIHDINAKYFKLYTLDWFYPETGYSDEYTERFGWNFDGQVFYRSAEA